jgi:hypothetical protein
MIIIPFILMFSPLFLLVYWHCFEAKNKLGFLGCRLHFHCFQIPPRLEGDYSGELVLCERCDKKLMWYPDEGGY